MQCCFYMPALMRCTAVNCWRTALGPLAFWWKPCWIAAPTAILRRPTAVERLSTVRALDGWAYRDLVLLRMRALLARTRGDEAAYPAHQRHDTIGADLTHD